jgi:hypothetical protein
MPFNPRESAESHRKGANMGRESENELLGAEDVAGLVGVKDTTVYRWCVRGSCLA